MPLRCACEDHVQTQHRVSARHTVTGACGKLSEASSGCNLLVCVSFERLALRCALIGPRAIERSARSDWEMASRALMRKTVGLGLLFLSGCDAFQNMRNDFARLASTQPAQSHKSSAAQPSARPNSKVAAASPTPSPAESRITAKASASASPNPSGNDGPTVALSGKSENELRALLGTPTSEEDRPPGKQWRYRDGQCTLEVQLYPDVQTKQFGTLAYEVKSDDNTDEGRRLCLAQLQTRVEARQ